MDKPQIPTYYANKKVLVTGGTGFVGKVLIWKLLHSCPMIDTIYVLIRPKHGKNALSRREELFGYAIFDEFKKNYPKVLEKVVFVSGDVGEEGIGLSELDRNIFINEVSVVFHGAAVLKMDADLKRAVNVNTLGTLRMLKLAENMKKLEAFVYISTAYCCCENAVVEEKLYPAKHNPYDVIDLVRWLDLELLNMITPKLIDPLPNTYTYSKRLTEALLSDFQSKIPLIVARPTIVIPAIKDPIPGWNDSMNGPVGLFLAGGTGILRTSMTNRRTKPNLVAVDTVVNGIITLPWANPKQNLLKEVGVYNIGQTEIESLTWSEIGNLGLTSFQRNPPSKILWYPNSEPFTDSYVLYTIKNIFLHWLVAYIIDFIMLLLGQKRFMVRVVGRIQRGENVLRYFARRQWSFANDKLLQIKNIMSDVDKQVYPVTMKHLTDTQKYMDEAALIGRKYLLKDDLSSLPYAKKKAAVWYYIDKFIMIVRYIIFVKILVAIYNTFYNLIEKYQTEWQEMY